MQKGFYDYSLRQAYLMTRGTMRGKEILNAAKYILKDYLNNPLISLFLTKTHTIIMAMNRKISKRRLPLLEHTMYRQKYRDF